MRWRAQIHLPGRWGNRDRPLVLGRPGPRGARHRPRAATGRPARRAGAAAPSSRPGASGRFLRLPLRGVGGGALLSSLAGAGCGAAAGAAPVAGHGRGLPAGPGAHLPSSPPLPRGSRQTAPGAERRPLPRHRRPLRLLLFLGAGPGRPRLPPVHLGLDRDAARGRDHARQCPPQPAPDPGGLRSLQPFRHRELAAALPRHGPDRHPAPAAFPGCALHPDVARLFPAAAGALAARDLPLRRHGERRSQLRLRPLRPFDPAQRASSPRPLHLERGLQRLGAGAAGDPRPFRRSLRPLRLPAPGPPPLLRPRRSHPDRRRLAALHLPLPRSHGPRNRTAHRRHSRPYHERDGRLGGATGSAVRRAHEGAERRRAVPRPPPDRGERTYALRHRRPDRRPLLRQGVPAGPPGRDLGVRPERRPGLLGPSRRNRAHFQSPPRHGRGPFPAHGGPRFPGRRRAVRHRPDQGSDRGARPQSLPAGRGADRGGEPPGPRHGLRDRTGRRGAPDGRPGGGPPVPVRAPVRVDRRRPPGRDGGAGRAAPCADPGPSGLHAGDLQRQGTARRLPGGAARGRADDPGERGMGRGRGSGRGADRGHPAPDSGGGEAGGDRGLAAAVDGAAARHLSRGSEAGADARRAGAGLDGGPGASGTRWSPRSAPGSAWCTCCRTRSSRMWRS